MLPQIPDALGYVLVLLGFTALAAVLAWRNVRSRRAYVGGAIAVGMLAFVTHVILAFSVPAPDDLSGFASTLLQSLSMALHTGVRVTLFYLALEPFARRRWPRALIAWSRLLEGRLGDPSVGREILVGLASGMAMLVLLSSCWLVLDLTGVKAWDGEPVLAAGTGTLQALGQALHGVGDVVMFVGLAVFLLVLLRSLIPQPWLGNAAWFLVYAVLASQGEGTLLQTAVAMAFLSGLLVLLTRLGFLAVVAYATAVMTTVSIVLTLRPGDWQFSPSVMILGAMAALALWAYRVSVAGRSAFE